MNGFMHGSQDLQTRPNQAEFLAIGTIADRHNVMMRGIGNSESQQNNAFNYHSGVERNSDRSDVADSPVSFDFLGNHPQVMRNHNPGTSLPRPGQQPGYGDVQFLQQQLLYRQLQEMQRQQQLQQLAQCGRTQNQFGHMPGSEKHFSGMQLPPMLSGMPVQNSPNHIWSSELGNDLKVSNNSQMLVAGNMMNWSQHSGSPSDQGSPNGFVFSNEQGQATRSTGVIPQQFDQSLCGIPVLSTRETVNYSQYQGVSYGCNDMAPKVASEQVQKANTSNFRSSNGLHLQDPLQDGISNQKQVFHGRGVYENAAAESVSNVGLGNLQQGSYFSRRVQAQDIHDKPGYAGWAEQLQQKADGQEGTRGITNPLHESEEKLLFSSDGDNSWNYNISAEGYLHGNAVECTNSVFPSVQSGSWSALVQEALGASSSDTGVQEEWGGLSFSHKDQLNDSQSAELDCKAKQQLTCDDNTMQHASASASRDFPFISGVQQHSTHLNTSNFQHASTKLSYEQDERLGNDASRESFQHSASRKQLDQNEQKQTVGDSCQAQIPSGIVPSGIWPTHTNQQSVNTSVDAESNAQSIKGIWPLQQKMQLPSNNSHSGNKGNIWNINERSSPGRENLWNVHDVDGRAQYAHSSSLKSTYVEMDSRSAVKNPDPQNITQQFNNKHQGDASNTPMNVKGDGESSRNMQVFGSALNIIEKASSDSSENRQENSTGYAYKFSHSRQFTDGGPGAADSRSFVNDNQSTLSANQNLTGQSGRRTPGPSRFQHFPAGIMERSVDSQNRTRNSLVDSQLLMQGWRNQEQGYIGHAQLDSHVANNAADIGKRHSYELHKVHEEAGVQSIGLGQNSSFPAVLDGSTPYFSQHEQIGHGRQNMLELLHKVDGTSDNSNATEISKPDHSSLPLSTELDPPEDISSSTPSSLQGFALGLAPPAPACSGAGDRERSLFCSADEASQKDVWNGVSRASTQASKEITQPCTVGDYTSAVPGRPYARSPQHHAQQQRIYGSSGLNVLSQSSNFSVGNPIDAKEQLSHASYVGQTRDSNFGPLGDQYSQASLPTSRVFPSRLASNSDNRAAAASQLHSLNTGLSQTLRSNFASNMRNPDQQSSVLEPRPVPQSSLSGMAPHGGVSTMLQSMWTSASAQRQLSAINAQRAAPASPHPMNPLSNSRSSGYMLPPKLDDQINRNKMDILPQSTAATPNAYHSLKVEEGKTNSARQPLPSDRADVDPKFGTLQKSSAVSIPSLVRLHEQELSKGKHVVNTLVDPQAEHASLSDVSILNHDGGTSAINSKFSDAPNQNYSLLQQMQAMKAVDSDFGRSAERRPGSVDLSSQSTQLDWKAGQTFACGQNTDFRLPSDDKVVPPSQHDSFASNVKILSFSAKENEDNILKMSDPDSSRETSEHKLLASAQNDLQNHLNSLNIMPSFTSSGGNGPPQISPSMAPTWFRHYGNYKNGQVLAIYDSVGSLQNSSKVAPQERFGVASEMRMDSTEAVQRHDGSETDSVWKGTIVSRTASSYPSNMLNNIISKRPKKRKSMASDLVPWRKKVFEPSENLLDISAIEQEWAYAANRLVEKVDDEFDALEEGSLLTRSKRRLVLATLQVQQLLNAIPSRLLRENASTSYESITYFAAKSTLADACNLVCHVASSSSIQSAADDKTCKRTKTLKNEKDHVFAKVADNFVGRSRKLENELLRLDKRVSILDLKMECQELERCSLINRFAKFHGRPQADGAEGSFGSESIPRRILPQRQAIMLPFPRNVPEGAFCLSL